jgi:ribose transport system ATP-binding protein
LVDGRVAADRDTAGMDRDQLVRLLARTDSQDLRDRRQERPKAVGGPLMAMRAVWGGGAGPVDLEVRPGQVIGLTGLLGSGLHDVAFLAGGVLTPRRGEIRTAAGLTTALVPPYREAQGGFADLSVRENLTISSLRNWTHSGVVNVRRERVDSDALVKRLGVVPPDADGPFEPLSGGNKQKVIFGRALSRAPDLYVLCEPTRGVDIATRLAIYELIREIGSTQAGVLIASSDVDDLLAVCDEVGVVVDGTVSRLQAIESLGIGELEAMV